MLSNVKVGDTLIWRTVGRMNYDRASGTYDAPIEINEVIVGKVGRKWITFGNYLEYKADKESGRVEAINCQSSTLYSSMEVMEDSLAARKLWDSLTRGLSYSNHGKLTLADVKEIEVIFNRR